MSNVRVRYGKPQDGKMLSRRNFTTGSGIEVRVELDVENKQYRVLDSVTGHEMASGAGTINLSVLKIKAKDALLSLGVEFTDEVRERENSVG